MTRIKVLLAFLILITPKVFSQELSVESFRLLENDLTANTYGTIEYDQNGQTAALIKIVTINTGFVFDGGMMGIVKTVQKTGEIWVYVPFGIQRITIAHPEFGVLRDFFFPISIDKARTYEMVLKTKAPNRTNGDIINNVNVSFDNPMENSGIYLNGILVGKGSWSGLVAATTFVLEVKQEGFVTYSTTIELDPDDPNPLIKIPQLEPVRGKIRAGSEPEKAAVYMNGSLLGKSPLLIDDLSIGTYSLEYRLRGYRPYMTTVTVRTDETYKADAIMKRVNNQVYAGAAYQIGHIKGVTAFLGVYLNNFNIEMGYLMPSVNPERTYWITSPEAWNGTTSKTVYDFKPTNAYYGSLGYGIPVGKRFCFGLNAGAVLYNIEGECAYQESGVNSNADGFEKATTYTVSGLVLAKMEFIPYKHVSLTVSPEYEIPLAKGSMATTFDENNDLIKTWCGGFSLKAGIKVYF